MAWSVPVAQAASWTAGIAVGELAGDIARELGASERTERIARQTANTLTSYGVRFLIHVGMADVVGLLTAGGLAAGSAAAYEDSRASRATPQRAAVV